MSTTKKKNPKQNNQHFLQMVHEKVPDQWAQPRPNEASKPDRYWEIEHVYGFSGDRMKGGLSFGATN